MFVIASGMSPYCFAIVCVSMFISVLDPVGTYLQGCSLSNMAVLPSQMGLTSSGKVTLNTT